MEDYEKFIKLLKEEIEDSNANQCQSEKTEYDPDIIFDSLIDDSKLRIDWIEDFHTEFKHEIAKRHLIRVGENLVKLLKIIDERKKSVE